MTDSPAHHITPAHYTGFGMIVNMVAELDTLLDEMILAMLNNKSLFALPLLTFLSIKDKRDYIIAISKESNLPPYAIDGLEKLMKRVKNAASLRNTVAHCGWKKGRGPDTIKPMKLNARETLKMLGIEHNERDWTAKELIAEAKKFQELGRDLLSFMDRYRLRFTIERKTSGKSSPSSQS